MRYPRKLLRNAQLTYEELETVLIEIESVLNSRPLIYVYEDLNEPPLTSSTFVTGRQLLEQFAVSEHVDISDAVTLGKRARYLELLISHVRKRWKFEYLTSFRALQRRHSVSVKRGIQKGDIVHVFEDRIPRQKWSMGKVGRVLPGRDGFIRSAELTNVNKSGNVVRVKRPIQKLYPLEVKHEQEKPSMDVHYEDILEYIPIRMIRNEDVDDLVKL